MTDPVSTIENDREFKAYIYQQLVDLQPFLDPDSQISVLVQLDPGAHDEDADGSENSEEHDDEMSIGLSLVATVGEYQIEAEGRDHDMYEAFALAKQAMIHQIEEFYSAAIDSNERETEIRSMLTGASTIH